jgi:hypothetical protein
MIDLAAQPGGIGNKELPPTFFGLLDGITKLRAAGDRTVAWFSGCNNLDFHFASTCIFLKR